MPGPTVLVVDDDDDVRKLVLAILRRQEIAAIEAADGEGALRRFFDDRPDLVVLDLGLPGLDGFAVLERIRQLSEVPVVLLSAEHRESEKVRGFDLGADDYVTKPFGTEELVARITRLSQRARSEPAELLVGGPLELDAGRRQVKVHGRAISLSPTEFDLLAVLLRNRDRVVTQQQLLEEVWGNSMADPKRVRLYVSYLRRKLESAGEAGLIETVRGLGYRLRADL